MDDLVIIYYDAEMKDDTLCQCVNMIKDGLGKNVIALPKQFDVMLNCSIDQLMQLRALIDTTIAVKAEHDNEIHQLAYRDSTVHHIS